MDTVNDFLQSGSSPRVRGALTQGLLELAEMRVIPARAGSIAPRPRRA
mgnify:CR=1 FL=1